MSILNQAILAEKKGNIAEFVKLKNAQLLYALLPNYKPTPKQNLFHQSNAYEKGIKGGYGSGKTTAFCAEAFMLAYANRPIPVLLVEPTCAMTETVLIPILRTFCDKNNYSYTYYTSKNLFVIDFGDTQGNIWLASGDRPASLKGMSVSAVGMDEPFTMGSDTRNELEARVRHTEAKFLRFFWSGTPEPQNMSWGHSYFDRDHDTDELFTITIPTAHNTHLPAQYIDNLKSKFTQKLQEVYLNGKLISLQTGRVYNAFDVVKNTELGLEEKAYKLLSHGAEVIISFDFNVDPMAGTMHIYHGGYYYLVHEWLVHSSNTREVAEAVTQHLKQKYLHKLAHRSVIITGDAAGKHRGTRSESNDYHIIMDSFNKAAINFAMKVPNANPHVRDRVNLTNKLLELKKYVIDQNCRESIRDRQLVSYKQGAEGWAVDKRNAELTHLSDSADYAIWNTQALRTGNAKLTIRNRND